MKKTLLEIAKEQPMRKVSRNEYSLELLELCLAYVKGEITMGQTVKALKGGGYTSQKSGGGSILYTVATTLKTGVLKKDIEILLNKK
jgi:hypothetical protein